MNTTDQLAPLEFNPDPDTVETIRTHLWLQRNARELAEQGEENV